MRVLALYTAKGGTHESTCSAVFLALADEGEA